MADTQEAVRRLTIVTTAPGADQAAASLQGVSKSMDGVTVASQSTEKATQSLDRTFANIERRYVAGVKAAQDLEKVQRQVNQAVAQNPALAERANVILAEAAARHAAVTKAANDNTTATGLNTAQFAELGHSAKAAFEQIAAGAPALKVIAQQGASTAQALSLGQGGIAGSLKSIVSTITTVLGPLGLVALGFAAVEAAALAWFVLMEKKGKTAEEILTEHDRLLKVVKNSYDNVTDAASKWYDQSKAVTQLQLLQQQVDLSQKLVEATTKAIRPTVSLDVITGDVDVKSKFQPFRDAIADLNDQWQNGKPDVRGYLDEVARIGLANPALRDVANELIKNAGDAQKFENALRQVNEAMKLLEGKKLTSDERGSLGLPDVAKQQADPFTTQANSIAKHTAAINADAQAVGASVGEHARLRAEAQLLEVAQRDGATASEKQKARIKELSDAAGEAAQKLAEQEAASRANFELQTVGLSGVEKSIAQLNFQLHGDSWKEYADSATANTMRITAAISEVKDAGLDFTKSFFQGLMQGKSGMDALAGAAEQLASKMADKALTDIFSGNFIQGGAEAVVAIGAQLFAGDQKAKKELQEAQAQWAKMADQVTKFNEAAAGVDLGPLTNELQSLFSSFQTLEEAARKAQDEASRGALANTLRSGIDRVVGEFVNGSDNLSPLQKAIKGVNDEAAGLKDTLLSIGAANHWDLSAFGPIDAAVQAKIKQLMQDAADTLTSSLAERLNSAQGKSYLNDAAALLEQHQTDLASAAELGNDPAVLAQIAATYAAEAQKIVQDAGLVGDTFADFTKMFPDLADVVHQATVDITDSIKTISQYLESLQVGSNSILSPQDQLAAAQAQFSQQLGLAQGGNTDALGSITKYADTLLDQAKSFYGSSEGYAGIYQAVSSALAALIGATPAIAASSSASSSTSVASTVSTSSLMPQVSDILTSGSSTDIGQYFATQTQALVQALGSSALSQIQAMNDNGDKIASRLDRLIAAMDNRDRSRRPSAKGGG